MLAPNCSRQRKKVCYIKRAVANVLSSSFKQSRSVQGTFEAFALSIWKRKYLGKALKRHQSTHRSAHSAVDFTQTPRLWPPHSPTLKCGDQGFIDLKLESVEEINHNTKKFRFALPNSDNVLGLSIALALLTKYKGLKINKPII